jgi:ubiquinone/menaquinone biosynthesis C-methylase UbiE
MEPPYRGGEEKVFHNIYEDADYAESYAGLGWGGTYHLVRRDLPGILRRHVKGRRALDFGCGTGRSARLLRSCGFDVTGVDIAEAMIRGARQMDPEGDYVLLEDGDLGRLPPEHFDLVLAAFPFDNIPAAEKTANLRALAHLLAATGRIVNIVSSPEIYTHEWASFSTREYPENLRARDGDIVRIVTTQFRHARPAEDVLCTDEAYRGFYGRAGLEVVAAYRPLATGAEGVPWVSETSVAPWVIYVLGGAGGGDVPQPHDGRGDAPGRRSGSCPSH